MTLREFDLFVKGRIRREKAEYAKLARLAFWFGVESRGKRLRTPEQLLGEKKESAQDAAGAIAEMRARESATLRLDPLPGGEHHEEFAVSFDPDNAATVDSLPFLGDTE